jgi:uncharacterized paraquat-inducible protein A
VLITCPECNSEVSDKAPACPRCGNPVASGASAPTTSRPVVAGAYQAVLPPRQIRSFGILIGLLLLGAGLYLALSWIPANSRDAVGVGRVVSDAFQGRETWVIDRDLELPLKIFAWALAGAGALNLVIGSTKRDGKLAFCKTCGIQVVAKKKRRKFRCERCDAAV